MAKDLETKCVKKVFPQLKLREEDKCPNIKCRGYDKYCSQYVPLSSINLYDIEQQLNHQENQNG